MPDAHTALDPVEEALLILSSRRLGLLIHALPYAPFELTCLASLLSVPDPQDHACRHALRPR